MSIASITGVFAGATVSSGAVTIPSGSIVSFIPSSTTSPGGKEMVFGICETMYRAVTGAGLDRVTASVVSVVPENGILRREYTFVVNLDLTQTGLEYMNVADE